MIKIIRKSKAIFFSLMIIVTLSFTLVETGALELNFFIGKDITFNSIVNSENVISAKKISNVEDSQVLDRFRQLKGYKDITFDLTSSEDFNTDVIDKIEISSDSKVMNKVKVNNLEIYTEYSEIDTGFFNTEENPVKQTYLIKNLLDEPRSIKLNIKYEIDSQYIIWNGTRYALSEKPQYFKAFYIKNLMDPEAGDSLTGHTLYFDNNYYNFADVVNSNLMYKLAVYTRNDKNYIDLEINADIDSLSEFLIDPEIGWNKRTITSSAIIASSTFAIDVDSDGDVDVLSSSFGDDQIEWYENNGSNPPGWNNRTINASALDASEVFAIDVDGDDDIDVLSSSQTDNAIRWYENNGASPPSWNGHVITTTATGARAVYAIDIDQDNDTDVIGGAFQKISLYVNNGSNPPGWTNRTITTLANGVRSIYSKDVDSDGDVDILSASQLDDSIAWYENNGSTSPGWTERIITSSANAADGVFAIDIDGDDDVDVVSSSQEDNAIRWYENNGSSPPSWTSYTINASANSAHAVYAKDVDSDGDVDVLSASYNDDKIAWYENNGASPPSWKGHVITTTANGATDTFAIDVDSDGDVDVLSASNIDNKIAWHESNLAQTPIRITEFIPIQVIEDVDLVEGKRTLVRTSVRNVKNSSESVLVKLFFNGTNIQNMTQSVDANSTKNFDFWHTPQLTGNNLEYKAEMSSTTNASINDTRTKPVDVVQTRNLTLTFVAVDGPSGFFDTYPDAIDFIQKTYPLADDAVSFELNYSNLQSTLPERAPLGLGLHHLAERVYKSTLIAGKLPERAVGIVPTNWFNDILFLEGIKGIAPHDFAVIIEDDPGLNEFKHVAAHELAHTYGLCDESSSTRWFLQNGIFSNQCPNGDTDNNGILDPACEPNGCPTSSLEPLSGQPDNASLFNFMGNELYPDAWIAEDSYNHLLEEFNHSTPINVQSRAVISGQVNKTIGIVAKFDNFYTLGAGLAENATDHKKGNYSIQVFGSSNNFLYNISFDVSFLNIFFGGNTTERNESAFAFTIPFNSSAASIVLKQNGITKDIRNVSDNVPEVTITSPLGGQIFSNELINISWSATDLDGDNLSYAVLFSPDNGVNYNTIIFDHNTTSFNVSSNDLSDCNLCRIKVLATDGVNTNESISNSLGIDNDLNITTFEAVYQNNTERIFKIDVQNTFTSTTISNISWEFNSGQDIKNSTKLFNLVSQEKIFVYIYHNYSQFGNYNVTFRAFSSNFIEIETKSIII